MYIDHFRCDRAETCETMDQWPLDKILPEREIMAQTLDITCQQKKTYRITYIEIYIYK